MAKNNPFVRFDKVFSIIMHLARGCATIVEHEDLRRNPLGVKPIADCITAKRGNEDVGGIKMFPPVQGNGCIGACSSQANYNPNETTKSSLHPYGFPNKSSTAALIAVSPISKSVS